MAFPKAFPKNGQISGGDAAALARGGVVLPRGG